MSDPESPLRPAPAKLHLHVVEGLHSGVKLPLSGRDYSIGSSAGADIVLRDDGVEPQHINLCLSGSGIRAEAVGGPLVINGREIATGHGYRLKLPAEISIGSASLHLSRTGEPLAITQRAPNFSQGPMIAAASVAGVAVAATLLWQGLETASADKPGSQMAIAAAPSAGRPVLPDTASTASAGAAVQALAERLQAAGIDTIKVAAEENHITASGQLPAARTAAWTEIQRWFDKAYAPAFTLTSAVTAQSAELQPAIRLQAIWYGERPYIIAENGIRYYEGAVLDSGWLLQQIGGDRVTLKRGEELVTINYR